MNLPFTGEMMVNKWHCVSNAPTQWIDKCTKPFYESFGKKKSLESPLWFLMISFHTGPSDEAFSGSLSIRLTRLLYTGCVSVRLQISHFYLRAVGLVNQSAAFSPIDSYTLTDSRLITQLKKEISCWVTITNMSHGCLLSPATIEYSFLLIYA